jgi:hypothetical protein
VFRSYPDTGPACGLYTHNLWQSHTDGYSYSYIHRYSYGYRHCYFYSYGKRYADSYRGTPARNSDAAAAADTGSSPVSL